MGTPWPASLVLAQSVFEKGGRILPFPITIPCRRATLDGNLIIISIATDALVSLK